ncbi:MAG: amidophosphoribosyltransferase [Candidatus Alcyoniella australis]|nr:amidophosphoribosyltransferase [Candidatus Alcyoniella australis]
MSGICGVVSSGDCAELLLFCTDYHTHLGSQLAGMAVHGEKIYKKIHDITQGQFKSRFSEDYLKMRGKMGVGVISDADAQPLLIHSRFGSYALAMAGMIDNKDELTQELFNGGSIFTETSTGEINSVELLAKLIETGETLVQGVEQIYDRIQGSASLLLLTADGIIAARDRLGRTPLVLGERNGDYMLASEQCAFTNLEFKPLKLLGPGEIVIVNNEGYRVLRKPGEQMQICSFLWIYTGYPASSYEWIGVEGVRERCGAMMARRDDVQADLVSGVPDSGMGHAVGYAMESGLPLRRALVKYTPGYGRSYIPPSQKIRDQVAQMKLLPVPDVIRGNRLVICEDSIVRGTQLKSFTMQKLWDFGAKEVHLRPACPPLMFPCRFALSTRKVDELIARRAINVISGGDQTNLGPYLDPDTPQYKRMVDWIAQHLGATTLRYQRLDDMIKAIGLPEENLCHYCWTGRSLSYEYNPRQRELGLETGKI